MSPKKAPRGHNPSLGAYHEGNESPNKGKTFEPNTLSREQVLALISACSKTSATGARNAALVAVMWGAGLRIDEALSLMPGDVEVQNERVRVRRGKGAKHRLAGLIPGTLPIILRWMDLRKQDDNISSRSPLFCTVGKHGGSKLQSSYPNHMLRRLKEKVSPDVIGPEVRVNPHSLRHSHADYMRHSGIDVGTIQKQLGHSSLQTTARYLDHVSPQSVLDAVHSLPGLDDEDPGE